jgi:hypothetical protein
MNIMKYKLLIILLFPTFIFAQSDFEKVLKISEFVVNGFSIIRATNTITKQESKIISSICIKNMLLEKITFKIIGIDNDGFKTEKEMVIQNDAKECVFDIPKGIYTYEILLSNKDTFKKGEYKFDTDVVITIKKE